MTFVKIIDIESQRYAEANAETEEEKKRMYEDFRNGQICAYRNLFNLYLHNDLSFTL